MKSGSDTRANRSLAAFGRLAQRHDTYGGPSGLGKIERCRVGVNSIIEVTVVVDQPWSSVGTSAPEHQGLVGPHGAHAHRRLVCRIACSAFGLAVAEGSDIAMPSQSLVSDESVARKSNEWPGNDVPRSGVERGLDVAGLRPGLASVRQPRAGSLRMRSSSEGAMGFQGHVAS